MELEVKAVHQPQGLEFFFGKFTGESALHLPPELLYALPDEMAIMFVVAVHLSSSTRDSAIIDARGCGSDRRPGTVEKIRRGKDLRIGNVRISACNQYGSVWK